MSLPAGNDVRSARIFCSESSGQRIVGDKVRRGKALDFSGCNSHPGTGSLHPVTIETAAEAAKRSELSM
jgi:hypothetical protein